MDEKYATSDKGKNYIDTSILMQYKSLLRILLTKNSNFHYRTKAKNMNVWIHDFDDAKE